jgi:hypothetical protein
MIWSERLLANRQRALIERPRAGEIALELQQGREVVVAKCWEAGPIRSGGSTPDFLCSWSDLSKSVGWQQHDRSLTSRRRSEHAQT